MVGTKGQVLTKQSETDGDANWEDIEANEVYIGKAEEAPETAKIIVEDEDFGEGAGLSKAEVYVGAEEPTTGEKVWFRKGKNLFNKDEAVKAHMFVDITNNKFVGNYEQAISTFIKIEGNTTYTISKTAGKTFRIATSKNMPVNSGEILSTTVNHEGTEITITTEPDAKYLFINYYNASNGDTIGEEKMKDSLQVEINTVATPYEDYVEPRIYIRNLNGVYEEFIKKQEDTGWINGTTIGNDNNNQIRYRKVGNIVYISSMLYLKELITVNGMSNYNLFTLPENFRPAFGQRGTISIKGTDNIMKEDLMYQINTNGEVSLFNSSTSNISLICAYFSLSYPV